MDIEFDFKGDPVSGIVSKCKFELYVLYILHNILSLLFTCTHVLLNSALINSTDLLEKVRQVT